MDIVSRAVWTIEVGLDCQLSLTSVANDCGISQFHLSRVFRSATGLSPMAYVRNRRLSRAAVVLAEGKADILDVAIGAQYNSHEAFTRAFSSYFGALPSTIRESGCTHDLKLLEAFKVDKTLIVSVEAPRIVQREAMCITGISQQYTFETNYGIPAQWQLFSERYQALNATDDSAAYGVCYDSDAEGRFYYMTGLQTHTISTIPGDMTSINITPGCYAVFKHEGHISDFRKTNYTIWNKSLSEEGLNPRRAPNFEVYDDRFDASSGLGTVDIWIPIT